MWYFVCYRIVRETYWFFRYDIPIGIKNLFYFFKPVWEFQSCDFALSLRLLLYGLERIRDAIKYGHECDEGRIPKVAAIEEAIDLLKRFGDDETLEPKEMNRLWKRLWTIISGSKKIPGSDMRSWWT